MRKFYIIFFLANLLLSSWFLNLTKQPQEEGQDIGQMQIKLLQKIEELTLYVIDLKNENEEMRHEIKKLKNK